MINWKQGTIIDLAIFQRGHDLPDSERKEGTVPVVGSAGINGYHNKAKAKGPGVTLGRSGASIGKAFYIQSDYWPHNAALYVKDFKGNEPKFVYYFLKSTDFSFLNSGSAQPSLNRNILHAIKIKIPPHETQKKIAAILSAYDDLIEINKQRISLLEKMAEEIYREWFVRFRFPGWQNIKFIKGVPERWKTITVKSLVKRIPPGKLYDQKTAYSEGEVPILDQGRSGIIGFHNDQPGVVASPDSPLIVFANHTCYQRLIFHPFSTIQNVIPFTTQDEKIDIYWLHFATKSCIG